MSSARAVLHDTSIPEVELEMKKGGVDVLGGSGYVASHFVSSNENSDVHVLSRTATDNVDSVKIKDITIDNCASVTEPSTQASCQESEPFLLPQLILHPEEVSTAASLPSDSMTVRAGSPVQQVGVKQASSEASILDLQDVEYADADAEDGDDEAEHEEERLKAPAEFAQQVDFEVIPTQAERGKEKEQRDDQQQEAPQSLASDVPETMTPDEAENLLSSRARR